VRAPAVAVLAICSVIGLGACGGGSDDGTSTTVANDPASGTVVEAKGVEFKPDKVSIKVGELVTWQFRDTVAHNVVADDKSFESKLITKGTFKHTFAAAGSYAYVCTVHPNMKGVVEVT
jgi:plastocyanin